MPPDHGTAPRDKAAAEAELLRALVLAAAVLDLTARPGPSAAARNEVQTPGPPARRPAGPTGAADYLGVAD